MKRPKVQQAADANQSLGYDRCGTPWHGAAPLLPYLPAGSRIWEPAAGDGMLVEWLREAGHTVIATDILSGTNFHHWEPDPADYDLIVTNPPYSDKYTWMRRCYALGKPWALLVPAYMIEADTAAAMYEQFGWEELRLRQRINFSMPHTGFRNGGALFTTWWLTWQLLPKPFLYTNLPFPRPEHVLKRPKKVHNDQLLLEFAA